MLYFIRLIRSRAKTYQRAVLLNMALQVLTLISAGTVLAHVCWFYASKPAVNPQPWVTSNPETGCSTTNYLHDFGTTISQTIGEEHRNWHCANDEAFTEAYGRAFLAFHRQFILDFDNYRLAKTMNGRLEIWDPFQNAPVPGNDETTATPFTHCSIVGNVRPAGAICTDCQNLPNSFIGSNLNSFSSLGDVGRNLDGLPGTWHGTYHNGVSGLGCADIGGFIYTPRDPAFWMAHKKLDEVARDWQSLQATDVVIVLDRSASMDDNCSSTTPPPTESPCAINDAREAARTFANLVLDVRLDGGVPAAQQHRLGLVSFASTATPELGLTSANGIITDNGTDDTPYEIALAGISTSGATSIASGIREAISILNAIADPNPHQAILVLTDGKENTPPCLGGNSPSSCIPGGPGDVLTVGEVGDIQIVAIGFGPGAEEANLRDVAERHAGIFVAEANVDNPIRLQKFFVTAFGEIFDAGMSLDPEDTMQPGQTESDPFEIEIGGDDERLTVVMGREEVGQGLECDLALELFTPSGTLVDRTAPGVEAGHGLRHDFIHVNLPYRTESTGTWTGRVVRPPNSSPNCEPQDYFYSVLIKGFGRIDPFVVRPNVVVGRSILATFRISESNRPIGGFDAVKAEVTLTRPDGTTETQLLFDDGTNGDTLAKNHIWSVEFPQPAQEPGVHHLRGHFELTSGGTQRVREAEYSIVVEGEPEQCTKANSGGVVNAFVRHRPQPGVTMPLLSEIVCVSNVCPSADQYELEIGDNLGWLKTLDPQTGDLVDLPGTFLTNEVPPFTTQCFGLGPDQGDPADVIPLLVSIPENALPGDQSPISIQVRSLNTAQEPIDVLAMIEAFPPPDCNQNSIDDALDIENGTSLDDNNDGVPDECEVAGHFHPEHHIYLPIILK